MLNTVHYPATGPAIHPALLIVHGLFGSARNWGAIARHMAGDRDVRVVDMRNHGESFRATTQSYPDMAGDLAEVIRATSADRGPMDVIGHSMGGKAAMVLALSLPDLVHRLVVADIAPVAYEHDPSGHIAQMRALDLAGLTSRAEADRRFATIVSDPALRAFFLQSLDLQSNPPRWRLGLDVLDAEMTKIVGWPEIPGTFDGPVLFVSGSESRYVLPEHRDAIRAHFPAAQFAKIQDAGHWLHAEKPREFEAAVRAFLG